MAIYSTNSRDKGFLILHFLLYFCIFFSIGFAQVPIVFTFNVNSKIEEIDKTESTFRYPNANSEIDKKGFLFDQFIWKFAGKSSDIIKYELIMDEWEIIHKIDISNNINFNSTFSYYESQEMGCPILKFVYVPWKINDGKLYFCKNVIIKIHLNNQKIAVPNYIPDVLNPKILEVSRLENLEYLILSPDEFGSHAEKLKKMHSEDVPPEDQLNTEVVYISEILNTLNINYLSSYNIKDFLEIKMDENPGLKYILIFGDETHFPPIFSGSTPSDDYYSSLEGSLPTIATGRIPVADESKAGFIINKIRDYTLNPSPGIWKQKFMLTADDYRKLNYSATSEIRHTMNSIDLYNIIKNNAITNTYYGAEYEPEPGEGWITLPEMTTDIISALNQGTAIINYIGHGSFDGLADEKILLKDRDIPLIIPDENKFAIWVVGTCSFGHYDGEDSMSEALLNNPGGAIALITTSRSVYTGTNIQFLTKIFLQFNDYIQGLNDYRLGDIAYFAKTNSNSSTYSLFHLYGDPALKLPFFIKEDIINDFESKNIEQMIPEYLELSIPINSQNTLTINNDEYFNEINADGNIYNILHPGKIILNNQLNSTNSFILPIDAPSCDSCLQINIYSEVEGETNIFDYSNYWSLNENLNISDEIDGPSITLFTNNSEISSGDLINIPANLTIQFSDKIGINTFGGLGHEITFQLNNEPVNDITHLFEGISDSVGNIQFNITEMSQYENEIKIIAWDNLNNKSEEKFILFFQEGDGFALKNVYPYPNPFKDEVEFTFHINEPANIEIAVFELLGKQLFKKKYFNFQPGLIRTEKWDGKSINGSPISNGVYFFTVKATSIISGKSIQKLQKLARVN